MVKLSFDEGIEFEETCFVNQIFVSTEDSKTVKLSFDEGLELE